MSEDEVVLEQTAQEIRPIVVPEGRLAAPRDYEVRTTVLELNGRQQSLELIKQTFEGNCAEYTALNTAIILSKAGMAINPAIEEYLKANPQFDLSSVETDLTIPLILNAQEEHAELFSGEDDVDNLYIKVDNPYEPLTNTNSALLFRTAVSPNVQRFEGGDVVQGDPENALARISSQETVAVFVGSGNHATSWVKLGENCYYVDPYYNQSVVLQTTETVMKDRIRETINRPGSFVTLNDLYTK
ncbi:hypothetical protein A2714_04845 [Candidatus Woesebacteria bacterium RIFCSPHIGHO2_01_FULL_38_9]|uniref:Uncharacterized protein n=2 Tax=Candidatus Woeseibacteriota TaxID=1752722 RepID=A0A1F7XZ59_9BACT|nr:MAG: hypothetical protein A2714_04845 [Candidatus Woesebacteria bacterium RIFCSPHIGHO2_01_FULL_38_9]OGM58873.1 MAG: hypothetical protein A3A75_06445 [Candidatus Woesebacteria bacterium RIFCSPLOWO2_01_FULL_39_10]